jgi:hypothetical protein
VFADEDAAAERAQRVQWEADEVEERRQRDVAWESGRSQRYWEYQPESGGEDGGGEEAAQA